ncbi:unnamed protein product [Anisakis simplex]|uniref:Chitin-binding type-2 domain-containing protein n=1 Tax=Anisakis simplex TaxID=6269 RepID=A0A0M3JSE7_ANISI|nr:unnamed protein product [Anisakis simplex]
MGRTVSELISCIDSDAELYHDNLYKSCIPKWMSSSCNGNVQRPSSGRESLPFEPSSPQRSQSCVNRPHGAYSLGCTSCSILCVAQQQQAMECPTGRIYDPTSNRCLSKADVMLHIALTSLRIVVFPSRQTPTPNFCSGHPDDAYVIGCSASYFICISRRAIFNRCSGGMVFDITVKMCRYKSNGLYAMGCSSRFYSCFNDYPSYYWCPRNLVFDTCTLTCVKKVTIEKCKVYEKNM